MSQFDIVPSFGQLDGSRPDHVPALFLDTGEKGWFRYTEFFTARIRNANTRAAYLRAARQFSDWCQARHIPFEALNSVIIAGYIEDLGTRAARPTVKQHLAALRVLFDFLVTGQVLPINPTASVRGPKHVVHRGLTPVLQPDEARHLIDSIDVSTVGGLRDRALIGTMVYSFARVGAVAAMDVQDYFPRGKRYWLRLHEKGGKLHEVPAHHRAEEYLDEYLIAAGLGGGPRTPLFRRLDRHRRLTDRRIDRREVLAMVKRRARDAGLPADICCHTFRATGITAYLINGGLLEHAQQIAAHESPRTTKLYDRTRDEVSLDEIEKILI
jgi:site-specific recombinase XerD